MELRLLDEELDKDDKDEDSFENLEEVSAIDPSALKDYEFVHELVQSLLQTYQMAS